MSAHTCRYFRTFLGQECAVGSQLLISLGLGIVGGLLIGLFYGLPYGLVIGFFCGVFGGKKDIKMSEKLTWDEEGSVMGGVIGLLAGVLIGIIGTLILLFIITNGDLTILDVKDFLSTVYLLLSVSALMVVLFGLVGFVFGGIKSKNINQTKLPGEKISFSIKNSFLGFLAINIICVLFFLSLEILLSQLSVNNIFRLLIEGDEQLGALDRFRRAMLDGLVTGSLLGFIGWISFGGFAISQHFALRFTVAVNNLLPWKLIPFLDHCVDLIFLRRVGGGYIFVHRLLMEHFATLASEQNSPKKNPEISHPRRWKATRLLVVVLFISLCCGWVTYVYLPGIYAYRGQMAAQSGDAEGAMRYYVQAAALYPSKVDYWNDYCLYGSLAGHATETLPACENAVKLAPENGVTRNRRGLARALTSDYKGAIDDFKFYVEWSKVQEQEYQNDQNIQNLLKKKRAEREAWIKELEAGRNPFDETTLNVLLKEWSK